MVRTLQVTLTSSATPVIPDGDIYYKWVVFQNNGSNPFRLGDANVSSTRGLNLTASGSYSQQPFSPPISGNLAGWFVFGTADDVVDVIYDDGGN